MYCNSANCDIYIGRGAGKKLLEEIGNAKKNVKIVSPYLSAYLIKQLIILHSKGIQVSLITSDDIEDYYGEYEKNIHKMIIQECTVDQNAQAVRNSWISLQKMLLYMMLGLVVISITLVYSLKDPKFLYGLIPGVALFLIRNLYLTKIKNKRIYNYHYRQLFPFKVFVSPGGKSLIHSKIYIIDDEVVYMGSLNFTGSGMKGNYETRIRTADPNAVSKIVTEFNELFHSRQWERDIQAWGQQLYQERIN
ncbi:MAG: phospholipase D family protein [Chryseobacterium sp.]|jgi:phosphatidylserine/phosphatidylglycerophosphate/cardiolipin synthase-like enzyme|uniref:phospholipase D family protein n=1 Tax=Chryseobacterium sp. TaxID=1871047 RepID=UPI00283203BD|nr:phospholipase D family protein [Chryseobacterium sp.]MDR2238692.1 phospholipase D family protein [Chryseobacterium sp.]